MTTEPRHVVVIGFGLPPRIGASRGFDETGSVPGRAFSHDKPASATRDESVRSAPAGRRLFEDAVESLRRADRATAVDLLRQSLAAGLDRPSEILVDARLAGLRNDPAARAQLNRMLREFARESSMSLVAPGEPGEPLWVTGIVRDTNGRPVAGALIYVFHTDSRGFYSEAGLDEDNPRLFGHLKTDAQGGYQFRTIRPGHYPDQAEPVEQHVHYVVSATGYESKIHRLTFSDDPIWNRPGLDKDPFWSRHAPFPPRWTATVHIDAAGLRRCECDIELRSVLP